MEYFVLFALVIGPLSCALAMVLIHNFGAKYRIIYVATDGDPCHWQAQERCCILFWKDLFGPASCATTAGSSIKNVMMVREPKAAA